MKARLALIDLRLSTIFFWVLFGAGIVLRLTLLGTTSFQINSDNAVVLLIAKHFSEGDIEWFFWGQNYGGSLVSLVAGAGMVVFGYHPEVLSVVSIGFFAVATLLVRSIATHAIGPLGGNVAGALSWFAGFRVLEISISELGFYGTSIALGLSVIWLSLRGDRRKSYLQWALVGLLAGLALWQSPAGIAFAAPGVVVALLRDPRPLRWLVGAGTAVVGALPWLWLFRTDQSPLKPQSEAGIHWVNFVTIFTKVLPADLSVTSVKWGMVVGAIGFALLVFTAFLAVVQKSLWLGVLAISSALVVAVTAVGPAVELGGDSVRYTSFLVPYLAVTIAWLATRLRFAGLVVMLVATAGTTVQAFNQPHPGDIVFTTQHRYIIGDIAGLGQYLEANDLDAVYSDYWISYSLTAETAERVTSGVIPGAGPERWLPYQVAAAAAPHTTIVVLSGHENDQMLQAAPLPTHTRTVVADDYAVYTFDQPFVPSGLSWQMY